MSRRLTLPKDIAGLGVILGIWAHPDDESFTAAGIMAAAVDNGQRVVCVTATKGEAGVQDESRWPSHQLAMIRQAESEAALKVLGVTEHHWLGYRDGVCSEVPIQAAVDRVRGFIASVAPDTILTFGPEGLTGHPDHSSVSRWVAEATTGQDIAVYHAVEEAERYEHYMKALDEKHNVYFNIDRPPLKPAVDCDIALELSPKLIEQKRAALLAMPSQYELLLGGLPMEMLQGILSIECFVKAK